jgi:hypothetical protein
MVVERLKRKEWRRTKKKFLFLKSTIEVTLTSDEKL